MANLGFGLYKEQIKDCVMNNIEKFLFAVVGIWLTYINIARENLIMTIIMGITTIAYTILFIFTLRDTIKAVKEYRKIRKEWKDYDR